MSLPIRFAREARDEALEAGRWYEQQRPGLRAEFLESLDEALDRSARLGARLPPMPGLDPSLGVRRVHMRRFPYAIIFVELTDRIRILAVAHQRRRPGYWRDRVGGR